MTFYQLQKGHKVAIKGVIHTIKGKYLSRDRKALVTDKGVVTVKAKQIFEVVYD